MLPPFRRDVHLPLCAVGISYLASLFLGCLLVYLHLYAGSPSFLGICPLSSSPFLSERTAFWVTPPGTHFSPGKRNRTFPSTVACTFPLKHVSAEAAKWLHSIILEEASRNAISELLCLTLYCPFCADFDGPQIILEWVFIWHISGKQLTSIRTFRFCTIYFLDCSTVIWVLGPQPPLLGQLNSLCQ